MLQPAKTKYRKQMRGRRKGVATRGNKIDFGDFALKATTVGWVTSRQIEASRKTIMHYLKRGGKLWIRIFPDKPITKKPPETRMGSGKGDIEQYVAVVKPGRVLFEIAGVTEEQSKEAFRLASAKLPIKTIFIKK
jgi:large subunit ribosomal protein L16